MYNSINFLKERTRIQELVVMRERKIATYTSIGMGFFLVFTFGVFFYRLFLSRQVATLEAATTVETTKLAGMTGPLSDYTQVTKKLDTIAEIMAKRANKWDAITYFYGILPQNSVIGSVDLKSTSGSKLEITVESEDVFAFEALSTKFQSAEAKQSGYTLEFGSLTRGKDGIYRMLITLTLKEDKTVGKKK